MGLIPRGGVASLPVHRPQVARQRMVEGATVERSRGMRLCDPTVATAMAMSEPGFVRTLARDAV